MKRMLIALLVLGVLAAGAYAWWINSPPYAVLQASAALKAHDVARFHNCVIVHDVAASAVDDLLAEPFRTTGAPLLERIVGLAIVSVLKPVVIEAMSVQIDNWVGHSSQSNSNSNSNLRSGAMLQALPTAQAQPGDNNDDEEESPRAETFLGAVARLLKPPSLKELFREYGLTRKNFRGLGASDTADHLAHVGLRFWNPKSQKEYEIKLELINASGHWQVSRIANLQDVVVDITGG